MRSLRCDLRDGLYLAVRQPSDSTFSKRSQFFLDLYKNESDVKPVASKVIPWPSNEGAPTELLYSSIDGIVKVKNTVTLAEVPLRLENLALDNENNRTCKVYKSFNLHIPESDKLIECVFNIVKAPSSKKDWKMLKSILTSGDKVMTLPIVEQEQLLIALMENKESRFFEDVCIAIQNTSIFGYKKLQEMAYFCIESGFMQIVIDGLGKHWYSEEIKAKILEYIASQNEIEAAPVLEKLLLSGISGNRMALASRTLSPTVSSTLLKQLMKIFCDITKEQYHSSALTLISTLIDATGSQIGLEKDLQGTITEIMDVVTDFAAVSDTFIKFEVQMAIQNLGRSEIETLFNLRRLEIKPRRVECYVTMVALYLLILIAFLCNAEENTQLLCDLDTGEWCGISQLCTPRGGETGERVGICLCVKGFHRQNDSKECFPDENRDAVKLSGTNKIDLKIIGPNIVQLPQKEVELKTETINGSGNYDYHWELTGGTGRADAASYNEPFLKLTNLNEGQLVYRVNVKNATHEGFDTFNFTILAVKRPNSAPKAVIRPKSPVLGTEGSQIVLDAEGSTDDDRVVSFNWYQDQGPSVTLPAMNTAVLKLDKLVSGEYLFSVVVTDADGLTGNDSVVVKVSAERDDPPKSRITLCGSPDTGSVSVRLPQEQLLLCGNASTDDKGIESYNWFRVDNFAGQLPVDVAGSSSSVLVLTNIQENEHFGPYEFQLDVADTKGQKDSSKILIFVNKAANLVPEVDAGGNQTLILPQSSLILNGNVKDDGSIVSSQWEQLQGPNTAVFSNGNQPKATVTGLEEGVYAFRLNVTDDGGLSASSVAYVSVERGKNEPPVARAPNVTVFLPHSVAVLNASSSSDDAGIVSYKWVPFDDVPAVMTALDGSENRAVMYVTGLVKGVHSYTLTVADQQKATNSVIVSLTVEQGSEDLESVEVISTLYPEDVSFRLRAKFEARISAVLASSIKEISSAAVIITTVEKIPLDGRLRIVFFATAPELAGSRMKRSGILPGGVIPAEQVVEILRTDANMHEDFHIVAIQPLYCKLTCSNHGYCSNISKECVCDNFWMTSLITLLARGGSYDCAWSSLYFWLLLLAGIVVALVCCIRKRFMFAPVRRRRMTRRAKYTSLKSDSDQDVEIQRIRRAPRLKPLPFPPSSDSLESEDELLVPNSWEMAVRNRAGEAESEKT